MEGDRVVRVEGVEKCVKDSDGVKKCRRDEEI